MKDDRLTVQGLVNALMDLGPDVREYEVWIEADPSTPVYPNDIKVWHDERRVQM